MTTATRNALSELGFATIEDYLADLADEYGVELDTAKLVFDVMGESELFDGVVSALEDAEAMGF